MPIPRLNGSHSHFRQDTDYDFCYTICNYGTFTTLLSSIDTGYTVESNVMTSRHTEDKQLQAITLESVLDKRRLDQALNAKEFAVCAGVSYSTARSWFHLPGFPAIRGVIFWQDFVAWRTARNACPVAPPQSSTALRP